MSPKILYDFIDDYDCLMAIGYIDEQIKKDKFLFSDKDKRFFQWNPSSEEAKYLVKKYFKKILISNNIQDKLYPHVALLVKYNVDSFVPLHTDIMDEKCNKDKFSMVLYFNDNYSGGNIYFPERKKEFHPDKQTALFYPSDLSEFNHGVYPVSSGSKYIMAFCFTENKSLSPEWYFD
jgi:hypothetical protein